MFSVERPVSDAYSIVCPFKELFLTKTGGLLGAIEIDGLDSDGMLKQDFIDVTAFLRIVIGALPPYVGISQYYVHTEGSKVKIISREEEISNELSQARLSALNKRGIASSRLVYFIHFNDPEKLNLNNSLLLMKNLPLAIFNKTARDILIAKFSSSKNLIIKETELEQRYEVAHRSLQNLSHHLELVTKTKILSLDETFTFMKFLATLNKKYLEPDFIAPCPDDEVDFALSCGNIDDVQLDNDNALKIIGAEAVYTRIASINKFPKSPFGTWAADQNPILNIRGDYVLQHHFTIHTEFEKGFKVLNARTELDRSKIDVFSMLKGDDEEKEAKLDIRRKIADLEIAEAVDDSWSTQFSQIVVFSQSPVELKKTVIKFDTSLISRGFSVTWEFPALPQAFQSFQPAGELFSFRKKTMFTTRACALSLINKSSTGFPEIENFGGEEAVYVFETKTGEPFYFNPFIDERAIVLGVGPTRSGKSFLKNTLSAHFLKYGGFIRTLDIDAGSEPLAKFFGKDGAIFRAKDEANKGYALNPFAMSLGEDDLGFISHITSLAQTLLQVNSNEEAKQLTTKEQSSFDGALMSVLRLPKEMQSLNVFIEHLPKELQKKFERWGDGGTYSGVLNATKDSIGNFSKKIGVFNLQAYRDDRRVLLPLLEEIFFRITREFENSKNKIFPKLIEIDECHHALSLPIIREFLIMKMRTFGKYGAGITMWTQSPSDYLNTPDWDAIKSSASTYIFLADGKMNEDLYKETFDLTQGQIDSIKALVPRKEAFIVQPSAGISKTIILNVEPIQHIINTSNPREATIRDNLIEEYGVKEGMRRAISEILEK